MILIQNIHSKVLKQTNIHSKSSDNIPLFSIKQELFIEMINKTKFAVSQNDQRRFANGILFENTDSIFKMVSTDGKDLLKLKRIFNRRTKINGIIVPLKIINEILKISTGNGDLKIGIHDKSIVFVIDNYTYISSLLEANFPSYEAVIPKNQTNSFKVDRKLFKEKIDRISSLGDKDTHKIILNISKEEMKIFTENSTIGYGEEIINIDYEGEDLKIALNYNFVIDVSA